RSVSRTAECRRGFARCWREFFGARLMRHRLFRHWVAGSAGSRRGHHENPQHSRRTPPARETAPLLREIEGAARTPSPGAKKLREIPPARVRHLALRSWRARLPDRTRRQSRGREQNAAIRALRESSQIDVVAQKRLAKTPAHPRRGGRGYT